MSYILPAGSNLMMPGNSGIMMPQSFSVPIGLVGYWAFDLDCLSTTKAIDLVNGLSTGDLQTGTTITYFPQVIDGPVGHALQFTAASGADGNSILTSGNVPAGFIGSELSAMGWIKTTSTGTFALISNYPGANPMFSFHCGHAAAGRIQLWNSDAGPSLSSTVSINDGFWHHAAVTMNEEYVGGVAAGRRIYIYLDGVYNTTTLIAGVYSSGSARPIGINRLGTFTSNYRGTWAGDDLRVYNRALSGAEIFKIYTAGFKGMRFSSAWQYEMPVLFSPTVPPSILYGHNIGASFTRKVTTIGY